MKKKIEKVKKDVSKEDIRSLLLHLESEYRKANISEKHYKELKEKYLKVLKDTSKIKKEKGELEVKKSVTKKEKPPTKQEVIGRELEKEEDTEVETGKVEEGKEVPKEEQKAPVEKEEKKGFLKSLFGRKKEDTKAPQPKEEEKKNIKPSKKEEEEIKEMTPEVIERLAQQVKEEAEGKVKTKEAEEKKPIFLKSIFGKKEKQEVTAETKESEVREASFETSGTEKYKPSGPDYGVEIEKLKVMIDTIRESGRVTDETVRTLSESIGEIRSMVFQADAELKESAVKMEKIEDDISEVRPQEISKKFREINENLEKQQLEMEKLGKKSEDSGGKINKVFEMLKSIGGIENLINVNKEIQKKLEDINEAMKYVERIGTKTEKMFIDLNKGLQDLIVIKAKQDDFNESLKDIIKNIDALNVKFEGYVTKKDLDVFKEDNMLIKKQIEDIKKILPIAELKLPENLINLRKEREDIKLLLDSLEEQCIRGKISKQEYETMKNANMKKLEEIRVNLESEWKKIEELIKPPEKEEDEETAKVEEVKVEEKPKEEKKVKESKKVFEKEIKPKVIERKEVKEEGKPEEKVKPKEKKKPKKEKVKQKIIKNIKPKPLKIIKKSEIARKKEILNKLKRIH